MEQRAEFAATMLESLWISSEHNFQYPNEESPTIFILGCGIIICTLEGFDNAPVGTMACAIDFAKRGYLEYSDDEQVSNFVKSLLVYIWNVGPDDAEEIFQQWDCEVAKTKPTALAA